MLQKPVHRERATSVGTSDGRAGKPSREREHKRENKKMRAPAGNFQRKNQELDILLRDYKIIKLRTRLRSC